MSYSTKYAKKHCEEALGILIGEGKVKKKEIIKNTIVYYQVSEDNLLKG